MKIEEVKKYLNKKVRYKNKKLGIDAEYFLTACILRQSDMGDYYYLAELADIKYRNSVIITKLEEVSLIKDEYL